MLVLFLDNGLLVAWDLGDWGSSALAVLDFLVLIYRVPTLQRTGGRGRWIGRLGS